MLTILCLIIGVRGNSNPDGDARRLIKTSRYKWGTEDDLIRSLSSQDDLDINRNEKRMIIKDDHDDIFDEISDLISNEDQSKLVELVESGGRSEANATNIFV